MYISDVEEDDSVTIDDVQTLRQVSQNNSEKGGKSRSQNLFLI